MTEGARRDRLARTLGGEPEEARLQDWLEEAEAELLLFLGRDTLPERLDTKLVALAACYARRDSAAGIRSTSFTEGRISGSETFLTPEDYEAQAVKLLDSLRRWRVVRVRGGGTSEA